MFAPQSPTPPFVSAIFIAGGAGQPMQRLAEVEVVAGRGIAGDRYALGTGYYSRHDPCEITFIDGDALDRITAECGIALQRGEHRRNIVTRGLKLRELTGKRLRIGDVLLDYLRPRPPCNYVERLTQPGMTRALGADAGIALRVVAPGRFSEGAAIEILANPDSPREAFLP